MEQASAGAGKQKHSLQREAQDEQHTSQKIFEKMDVSVPTSDSKVKAAKVAAVVVDKRQHLVAGYSSVDFPEMSKKTMSVPCSRSMVRSLTLH